MKNFIVCCFRGEAQAMRQLHGILTILWFIASFPICIWYADSIPFLVFVSVYAVVTGHWSSWQAARVEERQVAQEENGKA